MFSKMMTVRRTVVTKKVTKIEAKLNGTLEEQEQDDETNNNSGANDGGDETDASMRYLNGSANGGDSLILSRSGATTPASAAYSRYPKNYDSLINNKSLSAKERKRRQFLFGAESPQTPSNATEETPAADTTDAAPKSPEKNGETDGLMSEQPKADTVMPPEPEKKKNKKCCCVIS